LKILGHGWVEDNIGNLPISLIDSDRSKRYPKRTEFKKDGIAFLNAESISGGYFDISKVNYISLEKYEEITKGRLQQNDLILTMRGNGVGNTALFTSKIPFGLINAQMLILRPKEGEIHSKFLYYLFINPQFQKLLANFVTGSAQPQLTMTHLRHVPTTLPPLPEQKAIAHILGTLDDRIELNRRMNETLEGMAQALFKSWFVDFDPVLDNALASGKEIPPELREKAEARRELRDLEAPLHPLPKEIRTLFPDEFTFTDELGWIPKGWEVKPMNMIVKSVSETYPLKSIDKVVFLNTGDIQDGQFLHNDFSETATLPGQAKKSIKKDDILYSEIRPKNRRFAYISFDAPTHVVSTKLMVLRSISDIKSIFAYFILKQKSTIDYLQMMAESRSGTFPQITFDVLSTINTALPKKSAIINYFTENIIELSLEKSIANTNNSKNLAKLRDTLLPKLLSGEIRIPDAEKLVEAVG